jgi:hypothetical protein
MAEPGVRAELAVERDEFGVDLPILTSCLYIAYPFFECCVDYCCPAY